VTAYRYEFQDLQVVSFDSVTINYIVRNAAEARTQGLEGQAVWRATSQLRLEGHASYVDAKYIDFPGANCYVGQTVEQGCGVSPRVQDISGKQLPLTPKFSGRFGVSYDQPLAADLMLNLTADLNYKSKYALSLSYSPYTHQGSVTTVNAAVRLWREGEDWELALIGRNILDERYAVSAGDIPGGGVGDLGVNVGDPRTVALQATYRF
jgi:outer membrane receptor protein involved in Fe transport